MAVRAAPVPADYHRTQAALEDMRQRSGEPAEPAPVDPAVPRVGVTVAIVPEPVVPVSGARVGPKVFAHSATLMPEWSSLRRCGEGVSRMVRSRFTLCSWAGSIGRRRRGVERSNQGAIAKDGCDRAFASECLAPAEAGIAFTWTRCGCC